MYRALRQLDRIDAGRHVHQSKHRLRRVSVALATTAVVAGFATVVVPGQLGFTLTTDGFSRRTPLGQPPDVGTSIGTFAFTRHQPGAPEVPVTYDPCEVVHVELNNELAPPGGERAVRLALEEVSRATGLQFTVDGTTDRQPHESETATSLGFPSDEWSPVLIAWTTPDQFPDLAGDVAGLAGSQAARDPLREHWRYVTGTVALDAPALAEIMLRPAGSRHVRAIVMHELGHLVGLDHVDDPEELMHDDNVGVLAFGPGDREGLARLGGGKCR